MNADETLMGIRRFPDRVLSACRCRMEGSGHSRLVLVIPSLHVSRLVERPRVILKLGGGLLRDTRLSL
jgi:hypothetical protein